MFNTSLVNKKTRPRWFFLSLSALLLLGGCSGGSSPDKTATVAASGESLFDMNGQATMTSTAKMVTITALENQNRTATSSALEAELSQATAGPEARATPVPTRVGNAAEETSPAELEMSGTAVYEATAERLAGLQAPRQGLIDALASGPAIAGPLSGVLTHRDDGSLASYPAPLEAANFLAQSSFALDAPASALEQGDFGFLFWQQGQDFLALVVHSSGSWQLLKRSAEGEQLIQSGLIDPLAAEEWHNLTLYVDGNGGFFFLDQAYIADIILPETSTGGVISVATGFSTDSQAGGTATAFRDFALWPANPPSLKATPTKEIFNAP